MNDKRKNSKDIYDYDTLGKMLPQNIESEEYVLGSLLVTGEIHRCEVLKTDSFFKEPHKLIYDAMLLLDKQGEPIEVISVMKKLKALESLELVGGIMVLTSLANKIGSTENIEYHCKLIEQESIKRKIISNANKLLRDAYEDSTDAFELMEQGQGMFMDLDFDEVSPEEISPLDRMKETFEFIKNAELKKGITGLSTGLKSLDEFLGGWQESNVIVIGGKPGTFKTALALFFAHKSNEPCYMIEQEMVKFQTGMRELGMATGIDTKRFRKGDLTKEEWDKVNIAMSEIEKSKVFIEHENQTSTSVIKRIKWAYRKLGIKMAIIDYLQLTDISQEKGELGEAAIGRFMNQIKQTAKKLKIPIIVLSQFNRDSYNTKTKSLHRPSVGMFKGSGSIDATADVTILLWNICKDMHELGFSQDEINGKMVDGTTEYAKGTLTLCIGKQRMGDLRDIYVGVNKETNTFFDLDWMLSSLGIELTNQEVFAHKPLQANLNFEQSKNNNQPADDAF